MNKTHFFILYYIYLVVVVSTSTSCSHRGASFPQPSSAPRPSYSSPVQGPTTSQHHRDLSSSRDSLSSLSEPMESALDSVKRNPFSLMLDFFLFAILVLRFLAFDKVTPQLQKLHLRPHESNPILLIVKLRPYNLQNGPPTLDGSQTGHKLCNLQV